MKDHGRGQEGDAITAEAVEDLLREFRTSGRTMLESVLYLAKATGWPVSRAKQAVHDSQTWADQREEMEAFHDVIDQAARAEASSGG